MDEEVAMALIEKAGFRVNRWFKLFLEKNRSPHHWYDHDAGLG